MPEPVSDARRRDPVGEPGPMAVPPSPPRLAPLPHDTHVDGVVTAAVRAASARPSDAEIQARIDGVRDAFSGPYTVRGSRVCAPPMFRMNGGYNEADARAHGAELDRLAGKNTYAARAGYGGPRDLVRATQALIDAGKLPAGPPETAPARIKQMQWEWGIGVDCAAYTRCAFEAATGKSAVACGLRPAGAEDFTGLGNAAGFTRVAVAEARPGDIITLTSNVGEVGHNVIVRSSRIVAPGVHTLEVDSSWGAGTGLLIGGYRRDTWTYDEGAKLWTSTNQHVSPPAVLVSHEGPADERLSGVFRLR